MNHFLLPTRFLALAAVVGLLMTAMVGFVSGLLKCWKLVVEAFWKHDGEFEVTVAMIEVVDVFLIAVTLLIFALSLYEMFIEHLSLPDWMLAHNLHELKSTLSNLIVLVLAVKFAEHLAHWKDPTETLQFAASIALVSSVLIAFNYVGSKDHGTKEAMKGD